jgi:uracil-DNA glycosylase
MKHPKDILNYKCKDCNLWKSRTRVVWGDGNLYSPLVFVGEGPGREEDEVGLAFVGRAGRLLTKILNGMGIKRDDILLLNLVKCRPPQNRNPLPIEIKTCSKYLKKQLQCARNVEVIVALGRVPWQGLVGEVLSVTKYHGRVKEIGQYKYLFTYHPSYLARRNAPILNKEFMRDIRKATKLL